VSLTLVEDELGVGALEPVGDLESPCWVVEDDKGEAVPEDESFFLEDLLPSFALESCSCCHQSISLFPIPSRRKFTYHSRTKAFHSTGSRTAMTILSTLQTRRISDIRGPSTIDAVSRAPWYVAVFLQEGIEHRHEIRSGSQLADGFIDIRSGRDRLR